MARVSKAARLEYARQLLAQAEAAHAAYTAARPSGTPDEAAWERVGLSALLPAVRDYLASLASRRKGAYVLEVIETPEGHPEGAELPSRPAVLEDVVAWLEAVLEPSSAVRDVVLIAISRDTPERDWTIALPASSLSAAAVLESLDVVVSVPSLAIGHASAYNPSVVLGSGRGAAPTASGTGRLDVGVRVGGAGAKATDMGSSLGMSGTLEVRHIQADAVPVEELRRGAVEYNVGRTAVTSLPLPLHGLEPVLAIPSRPLSANALRVCAVLQGAWVATSSPGCEPDYGRHVPACLHASNRVAYTLRGLTRATFGEDGGRQREFVRRALEELGHETTEFFWWDAATRRYGRQVSHILSFREVGELPAYAVPRDLPPDAQGVIAWDGFLHESLMHGNYAVLPIELVRELSGADFAVWLSVLLQPATAELRSAGESREYTVSGRPTPLLDAARLGLGRQRPDKLRGSLERAAERGNALAERRLGLRLSVADRSVRGRTPGLKLVLTRTVDRASLRAPEDVYSRTEAMYSGTQPVYSRTQTLYSRTQSVRKTAPLDKGKRHGLETRLGVGAPRKRRARESQSANADGGSYPAPSWDTGGVVMAAWRERYPRPPSGKQLEYLAGLVAEADAPGLAATLLQAPAEEDALGYVKGRHKADVAARIREDKALEREAKRRAADVRDGHEAESVAAVVERVVASSVVPIGTAPAISPIGEAERAAALERKRAEEAEVATRRRANAVAMLREGLSGELAERLRRDYGITDEELRG